MARQRQIQFELHPFFQHSALHHDATSTTDAVLDATALTRRLTICAQLHLEKRPGETIVLNDGRDYAIKIEAAGGAMLIGCDCGLDLLAGQVVRPTVRPSTRSHRHNYIGSRADIVGYSHGDHTHMRLQDSSGTGTVSILAADARRITRRYLKAAKVLRSRLTTIRSIKDA